MLKYESKKKDRMGGNKMWYLRFFEIAPLTSAVSSARGPSPLFRIPGFVIITAFYGFFFYKSYRRSQEKPNAQNEKLKPLWKYLSGAIVVLWMGQVINGFTGGTTIGYIMCYISLIFIFALIIKIKIQMRRSRPKKVKLSASGNKAQGSFVGAVVMLVLGSVMTIGGTISAIYGNYQNNHVDAQRFYDAAQDFWYNGTVDRNPGDPFFIAGLVVLGVGAVLLIGGVAWLIVAKNKRDN